LDGNTALLKDLAIMFNEDAPVLLEELKNAVKRNHPMNVRSAVHSLKGLIATFYAKTGVEIAQRLEDASAAGELDLFYCGELDRLEACIHSVQGEFEKLGWVTRPRSTNSRRPDDAADCRPEDALKFIPQP